MSVDECDGEPEGGPEIGIGKPPENARELLIKLCWTGAYMLYMASAVGNLVAVRHSTPGLVFGWLGLAAFVGPYLYLVLTRKGRRGFQLWQGALLVWLYALATGLTFAYGSDWLVLLIYVAIASGAVLPVRKALWAVPGVALSLLGVGLLVHGNEVMLAGEFFPALLGGAAMFGVVQMRRTMRELREARATVARLAATEERLRLARDLHDLLGHSLSLITLKSELAGRMLPDRPDDAAKQVADIEQVSRQALVDVREAVSGFRRPTLGVELAGARTALRTAGVEASIAPSLDRSAHQRPPGLGPEEEGALAWALREAVTNIVRHSGAGHCELLLDEVWEADETRYLRLEISDDGRGPGRAHHAGNGLGGLEERLALSGGRLRTGPSRTAGFCLQAYVPLRPAPAAVAVAS
ncbi:MULTISPECIES: sensor histidine kinase [Streptomycetaceae]|nr:MULTISPECIES: sensor histidine kinase [Streptomycetaceae]MYS60858.1 sensor histidine kinase [Streptomyces sp. SID5468]CCB76683.1 Two-component system sensor kinase [Streptantibioticus cattleyicolor NRRL 8057 = DSM 46488]